MLSSLLRAARYSTAELGFKPRQACPEFCDFPGTLVQGYTPAWHVADVEADFFSKDIGSFLNE